MCFPNTCIREIFESYANHPSQCDNSSVTLKIYNVSQKPFNIFISMFVNLHMRANKHFNQNILLISTTSLYISLAIAPFHIHQQEIHFHNRNISPLKPQIEVLQTLSETTFFLLNKNSILVYYRKMSVKFAQTFSLLYHLHTPTNV